MSDVAEDSTHPPHQDGKSETSTSEYTNSQRFYFDDGDIVIQSSDLVKFKVHSYQLMAASTVFRGMIQSNRPQVPPPADDISTIALTDEVLETARKLERFFSLVYHGRMPIFQKVAFRQRVSAHVHLWGLLRKYDCGSACEAFKTHLLSMSTMPIYDTKVIALVTFMIAAAVDFPDVCQNAIRYGRDATGWADGEEKDLKRVISHARIWDLPALSLMLFEMIPHRYILAYERAAMPKQTDGKEMARTREEIADRFGQMLKSLSAP